MQRFTALDTSRPIQSYRVAPSPSTAAGLAPSYSTRRDVSGYAPAPLVVDVSTSMRRMDDPRERDRAAIDRLAAEVGAVSISSSSSSASSPSSSGTGVRMIPPPSSYSSRPQPAGPHHHSSSSTSASSSSSTPFTPPRSGDRPPSRASIVISEREAQIARSLQVIKDAQMVDICFLLDCTGSMETYIDATKHAIGRIIESLKQHNAHLQVFAAFVGYRDHGDVPQHVSLDFTQDYEHFRQFVGSQRAFGGGDGPEDVFGGLHMALSQLRWSHATRILLHLGDYPHHGREYSSLPDDFPGGYGPHTEQKLMQDIMGKNILYFFGKITHNTDLMMSRFATHLGPIPEYDFKQTDLAAVIDKLVSTSVAVVMESMVMTSSLTPEAKSVYAFRKKEYKICKVLPVWHDVSVHHGTMTSFNLPASIEAVKAPLEARKTEGLMFKRSYEPFDEGADRLVFYGSNLSYPFIF
eukprot:TRINITY_DN3672_c0_g2_i12.p1 TRINITY_DN3672_c0_g2~~TRINITY_DN3672_c0_g2_i12.p1  ORF type:complete len:465 (+),score=82.22 TRINITY_DN3672_c0_g2_i12:86-1480(+)